MTEPVGYVRMYIKKISFCYTNDSTLCCKMQETNYYIKLQ